MEGGYSSANYDAAVSRLCKANMLKRLDWYIIIKFLSTYFLSIVLIMGVAIVFDITEKLGDFMDSDATMSEIVWGYYLNFVPYYLNMFSQLFIFISVIFFTSKLAGNSEIIAMMAAGVSYERLMRPYAVAATFLFVLSLWLTGYVIPRSSQKLLEFEWKYINHRSVEYVRNVQMVVEPGTILYIESYQKRTKMGYRASLEHFEGKLLTQRITAERIRYDSAYNWTLEDYTRRRFEGLREEMSIGKRLDTIIPMQPDELFISAEDAPIMTNPELKAYIDKQRERGTGELKPFETEWWKRWASPVGVFVMTLLGVTLSSKKVRGGMGKNLGIGVTLAALYILFSTTSTTLSVGGVMSPFMAVWLPNIVFTAIGMVLYWRVRK